MKNRNTNVECLRIGSMFFIIAIHVMRRGYMSIDEPLFVRLPATFIGIWSQVGVDLFIIMSAWYMCEHSINIRKILSIIVQLVSYIMIFAVIRFSIMYYNCGIVFAIKDFLVHNFYDILHFLWIKEYWFVSAYIIMYISASIINRFYHTLKREEFRKGLIIFSFIPIVSNFIFNWNCIQDAVFMIYIYSLVSYIKKYQLVPSKQKCIKCAIICFFLISTPSIAKCIIGENILFEITGTTISHTERFSLIMLVLAFSIFGYVIQNPERHIVIINSIATTMLGVYMVHEYRILDNTDSRGVDFFFRWLEHAGFMKCDYLFCIRLLISIVALFVISDILEFMRYLLLQKPIMKIIDKHFHNYLDITNDWINK